MASARWALLGVALSLCAAVLCQDVIQVKEGENAEFKCNYRSTFQNPRVEWKFNSGSDTSFVYYSGSLTDPYKNRADIYPQGLRLRSVTRKDSGYYVCEVTGLDTSGNAPYEEISSQLKVLCACNHLGD